MSIWLKRLPDYGLELYVYAGVVTAEDLFRHFSRLDPPAKWLSYFDPAVDLSNIHLVNLPALKSAITIKELEKSGGQPRRHAMVNAPEGRDPFIRFWCAYAALGAPFAHERALFATLQEAYGWLGVPATAHEAVVSAIAKATGRRTAAPPEKGDRPEPSPHG